MKNIISSLGMLILCLAAGPAGNAQNQPAPQSGFRNGVPADHLPPYVKMVSGFGERPDWSHDGQRILFVEKPMGEVYEMELATGLITPKTRHFNHYGFTRALYLSNGDMLLSGPVAPFDHMDRDERERARDLSWLSILNKDGTQRPVPLNVVCAEGPAVSRNKLRIAWTERDRQNPNLGKNHAQHFMAEIVYENGVPKIKDQKLVFDSHQLPFQLGHASLETQNFIPPNDTKLVFTVYQIEDGNNTDTYIVDTETGEFQNITQSPGYYDEPEGIFPDGLYTCVEHGPSQYTAWPLLDLFKLKLDGSGEMQRLTYFSDFKNYKATQGVVSDDGRYLCFQIGKSGDEAGVGYGFFIMDLEAAAKDLEPFQKFSEGLHPLQKIADQMEAAWNEERALPAIRRLKPDIALDQAYAIQRAWVFETMKREGVGGLKGGAVTPGAQASFGISEPIGGVLPAAGRIDAGGNAAIRLKDYPNLKLETEIGFVVSRRMDKPIATLEEFKAHVGGLVPVIELPAGSWEQPEGTPQAVDFVAINLSSAGFVVGSAVETEKIDPKELRITFAHNGKILHETDGSECWRGPWETGLWLAQFAHRQGIVLEPGQIIICGALGQVHPGKKGRYVMDAGKLGKIELSIK